MPEGLPLEPDLIDLLASDTRREILGLLQNRRMTVTELADELGLQKATVHEHLKKLVAADLVSKQEDDRLWVYYELAPKAKRMLNPDRTRFYLVVGLGALAALVVAGAVGFFLASGGAPQSPTMDPTSSEVGVQVEEESYLSGPVQLDARLEGEDAGGGTRAYLLSPEDADLVRREDPDARGIPLTVRTAEDGSTQLSTDASVPEGTYYVFVRTPEGADNRATMPAVTVEDVDVELSARTWHTGFSGPLELSVTQAGAPVDGLVVFEPTAGEGASLTAHLAGGNVEVPAERLDHLEPGEHRVRVLPEDASRWVDAGSFTVSRPAVAVTPPRVDADAPARLMVHATGSQGPIRAEMVQVSGADLLGRRVEDEATTVHLEAPTEDLSVQVGRQVTQTVPLVDPVDVDVIVEDGPTFTLEARHANGTALSGAAVRLDGDGLGFTNATGALEIDRPPEGVHRLTMHPPDGEPVERAVDVDGWHVEATTPSLDVTARQTARGAAPAVEVTVDVDGPARTPLALTASVDGRPLQTAALEAPPNGTARTQLELPTAHAAGQRLDLDVDATFGLTVSVENRTTSDGADDGGGGGGGGSDATAESDDGTQLSVDVTYEAIDDTVDAVADGEAPAAEGAGLLTEPVLQDRARDGADGTQLDEEHPETPAPGVLIALAVLAGLALARRRWA